MDNLQRRAAGRGIRRIGPLIGWFLLVVGGGLLAYNTEHMTLGSTWFFFGVVAVTVGACVLTFADASDPSEVLRRLCFLFLPLIVVAWVLLLVHDTSGAVTFTLEDGPVENLQVVLYLLAAALLVIAAVRARRHEPRLVRFLCAGAVVVLIVMAGEEISWGQRIFDLDTAQLMLDNNEQLENNLHNLNSAATENGLSVAAFLVFVLVPFFSPRIVAWVERLGEGNGRLSSRVRSLGLSRTARLMLPTRWMALPFSFVVAFPYAIRNTAGTGVYLEPHYVIMIALTTVLLARLILDAADRGAMPTLHAITVLVILLVSVYANVHFQSRTRTISRQATSEFRELIIGIALVVYGLDLVWKAGARSRSRHTARPVMEGA